MITATNRIADKVGGTKSWSWRSWAPGPCRLSRLAELAKYEGKGVVFCVDASSGRRDRDRVVARVHGIEFDPQGSDKIADRRWCTGVVVLTERAIVSRRIDDHTTKNQAVGDARRKKELVAAIGTPVAGKPVAKPETAAVGC
jgi:hypothetical protein